MKHLTALFLTLYCSLSLSAQNAKIDSLKRVITTTKVDTVKGRSLCRLCDKLKDAGEMESALQKGEMGLQIVEQKQDQYGIGKCLETLGIYYYTKSDYPKSLAYLQRSNQVFENIKYLPSVSTTFSNMGLVYTEQGLYDKAISCYQKSLKIDKKLGKQDYIAVRLLNIGNVHGYQGNYPQALNYYFQSLSINERINDDLGKAHCLLNIGEMYRNLSDWEKALGYCQKGLVLFKKLNIQDQIATASYLIACIYGDRYSFTEAIKYFNQGLLIYEKTGNQMGIAQCISGIGHCYHNMEKYAESIDYKLKSLKILQGIGYNHGICQANITLAYSYLMMKQALVSKIYGEKGLEIALEMKDLNHIKEAAYAVYSADSALGDWKSAFEHHKLYKQYSDSLHNEEKAKEFGRIESRYQFEKEAEEQKRKEAEAKRLAEIETERRNNLQYLSIFAGILVLFGGLAFMGRFKIPVRVLDIALFAALLILFEFLLILFDPILDQYTGGIPIQKLVFNSVIALGFAPLHGFLEGKLRKRLVLDTNPQPVAETEAVDSE